jgi:non-ribosomal peptide synthetase-like protein
MRVHTLHALFADQARRTPDITAIEVPPPAHGAERVRLSYAQLDARADALAARLTAFVERECVVALALPRAGVELFVAQLAIHKAGAAWTCLEPGTPIDRLRFLLQDSAAVAVVALDEQRDALVAAGFPATRIVSPHEAVPAAVPTPRHEAGPDSLAYVIYTSGTTGMPKGVMIEHRMAANLVLADVEHFGLGPGDRVAQTSSPAYDSSVEETWLAWGTGATLVVVDDERVRSGPDLVPFLRDERITVWCPAPTLLRMTGCEDPARELPNLRLLYVGGEELTADVADRWAVGRRLENGYGPTECTVTVVRGIVQAGHPVTIGRPVRGHRAFVVDESLVERPDGETGELLISGAGVARGYLGRPDLTAERFVEHPVFGRVYRTGDLVRRDAAGELHYLGRADTQVKVRGHRIELTAIESELCRFPGVLEAACRVQSPTTNPELVAFVVMSDDHVLDADAVRAALRRTLPEPMIPGRIARLDRLPRGAASGKLDRKALPMLEAAPIHAVAGRAPQGESEIAVAAAFARRLPGVIGADADFFLDLGGNSLLAAQVISDLRRAPRTATLTVRDLYEARTVAALAARLDATPRATIGAPTDDERPGGVERVSRHATLVTGLQVAFLAVALLVATNAAWLAAGIVMPALVGRVGIPAFVLLLPTFGLAVATVAGLAAAVATVIAKRALIGRYAPGRHPYLGSMYLRHWIVTQFARAVPWEWLESLGLRFAVLRLLGARIGRDVHVHRGVGLHHGAWDLLTIEDGATLGRDASLGLVTYDRQQLVFAPVSIGARATLDTRARMSPGSSLGREAFLGPLAGLGVGAHVPDGERWDGVPAERTGSAPPDPPASAEPAQASLAHRALLLGVKLVVAQVAFLPVMALALVVLQAWLASGTPITVASLPYGPLALATIAGYALSLPLQALLCRSLGRVSPGVHPIRGRTGLTLQLKERLVETANVALSGTLAWPTWLRWAGMRVGRRCEISTIMEVTPELVTIADDCFFADGIYLGRPLVHRGHFLCERTSFQPRTFLGNHAVIPAGSHLPGGILLGVCTVAEPGRIHEGSSWFGNPAFELPRRELVAADESVTFRPSPLRVLNRALWEASRLALPVPLALALAALAVELARLQSVLPPTTFHLIALPTAALALGVAGCLAALLTKWTLLGRMREGHHALWSCWCSRWDFLFEVWSAYARPIVEWFEGTALVAPWLRAMGARIGKRVVMGTSLAQLVDPDMLEVGDDATVSCHLQMHSFEDRVLKLGVTRFGARSSVGAGSLVLYGADLGEGTRVAEQGVVMKHEHLLPGHPYEGVPTRPVQERER